MKKIVACISLVTFLLAVGWVSVNADDATTLVIEWMNPFNPSRGEHTHITYHIKDGTSGQVYLRIYDIAGYLVRTLRNGQWQDGGTTETVIWNGTNDNGREVGSGIYLVNLKIGNTSKTTKVAVLK